ncbi:MAG TPA: ATP-binding protein [Stellaceae bacterium]|nr:ATP-binding protein [Stellaceae bacterium]
MRVGLTRPFRDLSIGTKMLAIILPLIAIPMIILGAVGYISSAGEATASGARYLKERGSDLRAIADNPSIRDYFDNRHYGLLEEAEVYRRDLERSLLQFAQRLNSNETIYRTVRYVDDHGIEIAKITGSVVEPVHEDLGQSSIFLAIKQLQPNEIYASSIDPEMTYAIPVYETSGGSGAPIFQGAVILDFLYPIEEFRRSSRVIALTFIIITSASLAGAILLTVYRVRRLTYPIRRLADAANLIAAGQRDIDVTIDTKDEVGRLAHSFNEMAAALKRNEEALQRKIVETTALYEIGQEISAQVTLQPTLDLIVKRACTLLKSEVSLLALREDGSDEFVIRARTGDRSEAAAGIRFRPGEGLGGQVVSTGAPMRVGDYLGEYSHSPFVPIVREMSLRSFVAVPLKADQQVIGVLFVLSAAPHKFDEEDIQLLAALATQATISINNATLYQQVQEHAEQLEARIADRTRQLRELNEKLEEASRHKSEFLANMSHELRTPMNAIIGFTRLVMRRSKDQLAPRQYENLQKSLTSAEHLLTLINQILDLSKIEAGRLEVYASRFRLDGLVEECLRTVEPMVRSDGLELLSKVDQDIPEFISDEDKLKQILLNLLSNAVKFTERGRITVSAQHSAGWASISVSDTGSGIPADKLELIFEEFRQVDGGATRQHGGTGLGLSISRHLARLLGGDIVVDSTLGQGSTFTVNVPVHLPSAEFEDVGSNVAKRSTGSPR